MNLDKKRPSKPIRIVFTMSRTCLPHVCRANWPKQIWDQLNQVLNCAWTVPDHHGTLCITQHVDPLSLHAMCAPARVCVHGPHVECAKWWENHLYRTNCDLWTMQNARWVDLVVLRTPWATPLWAILHGFSTCGPHTHINLNSRHQNPIIFSHNLGSIFNRCYSMKQNHN